MKSINKTLEDGRKWNGLAYVHDAPVSGCTCGSCEGFFPRSNFKVGDRVYAIALPNGFPEPRPQVNGLVVRSVRFQDVAQHGMKPYYRIYCEHTDYRAPVNAMEGAERFFEHEQASE